MAKDAAYYKNDVIDKINSLISEINSTISLCKKANGLGLEYVASALETEIGVYTKLKKEIERITT
jgi:hypothetical protein